MPVNVGTIDQYVRIVVGLALVAYALQDGLFNSRMALGRVDRPGAARDGLLQELPALHCLRLFEPQGTPVTSDLDGEARDHCRM